MEKHIIFVRHPAKCDQCIDEHRAEILLDGERLSAHWCPHTRTAGAVFYGEPGQPPEYSKRENITASMANHWFNELLNGQLEMKRVITGK